LLADSSTRGMLYADNSVRGILSGSSDPCGRSSGDIVNGVPGVDRRPEGGAEKSLKGSVGSTFMFQLRRFCSGRSASSAQQDSNRSRNLLASVDSVNSILKYFFSLVSTSAFVGPDLVLGRSPDSDGKLATESGRLEVIVTEVAEEAAVSRRLNIEAPGPAVYSVFKVFDRPLSDTARSVFEADLSVGERLDVPEIFRPSFVR